MTDREVHPVAALFPMLADDELDELAADIRERGLLHPIVLDGDGRVLDGRNRLAACERAEVEPDFVTYNGDDSAGYALAVNIARRHLTKGQQAAVIAKGRDLADKPQRWFETNQGVSHSRIAYAATVRDHAPHLLDAVIAGGMGLDEAYKKAREIKTAADSTDAQIARLRAEDSELADRVVEGELTLKAAWVEREARVEEDKRQRRVATGLLDTLHTVAGMAGAGTGVRYEPEYVATGRPITAEVIDLARRAIDEIEAALKERDLL